MKKDNRLPRKPSVLIRLRGSSLRGLRPIPLLAIATLATCLSHANPEEPADTTRPAPTALNPTIQDGEIIGREQQRRVFMNVGGRRLLLVVPQGFRAEIANPEKVVLVNRDYSSVLSFRIAVPGNATPTSLNPEQCRGWLTARHGNLKIQDEFTLTAANQSGPAFNLSYKADGLTRSSQVTFIPSPVGVLEFNLAASPEKFQAAKAEFHSLLLRFRISDPNGRLEILTVQAES